MAAAPNAPILTPGFTQLAPLELEATTAELVAEPPAALIMELAASRHVSGRLIHVDPRLKRYIPAVAELPAPAALLAAVLAAPAAAEEELAPPPPCCLQESGTPLGSVTLTVEHSCCAT